MRLIAALFAAALLLGGCGIGPGEEHEGGAVIRVTRDFGHKELGSATTKSLREDQTVMRLTTEKFDVSTRFGGRFVQAIDGLKGQGAGGSRDWFFFVNGVESETGAAEYELSAGDRVQWDYRDWGTAMRVPAIVGSFPAPFLTGIDGKRRPVRVECDDAGSQPCNATSAASLTKMPARVSERASPPESSTGTFQRASAASTRRASARSGVIRAAVRVALCDEASLTASRSAIAMASDSSSGFAASISVMPASAVCFCRSKAASFRRVCQRSVAAAGRNASDSSISRP